MCWDEKIEPPGLLYQNVGRLVDFGQIYAISAFHLKFIADSPYGAEGPVGMVLNLFTEPLNMYVHRPGVSDVLISPDVV